MWWPQCLRELLVREILYVGIKISLEMYAILLQFFMEVKPAFPSYPSSTVGRLWTRQAAWCAEWHISREVAWQPVISQKYLLSGMCHISSLSLHFKMEKRQKYSFSLKMDAYNSCTPLILQIFLRNITWKLKYCFRKYFVDWRKWNILTT